MMYLIVPLSVTLWEFVPQLAVARLVFTSRLNPAEGEGQYTIAVLVAVSAMPNTGAPGVCKA